MKLWPWVCFGLAACAPAPPTQPNIVVIVMDTVRQDHLSCYGYERETTPFLTELGAQSTVYDSAHSTSGWTSPAHASLFTGLFPIAHQTTQENWSLSQQRVTLAETLSAAGYETVGIAENPMLSKRNGFDQGFATYHEVWREEGPGGERVVKHFHEALTERDRSKPLFTFVNLMGAHSPYRAPKEFSMPFVRDKSIRLHSNLWREYFLGEAEFVDEELQHLRDLYDGEVLYTDSLVRRLADELKSVGLWDNTVFVVTSDHGENIGDHELMDHVFSLYESTTSIPLIIHDPQHFEAGRRETNSVQLTDLFSTLVERAGVESVPESQGCCLLQAIEERPVLCEYYYPRQALLAIGDKSEQASKLDRFRRRLKSIQVGPLKLIWASDGKHELYDLSLDPGEEMNLVELTGYQTQLTELEQRLHRELERFADTPLQADTFEPDPDSETRRALREIGYSK